jgi:ABC-2 type transport system permease protein
VIAPAAILEKDIRLRMRGWRWAGVATLYVAILAVVALGFLLQKFSPNPSQSAQTGIQLFQALAIVQMLLIVFITPASVAGAISGERQHRTWDLLLLSRLSSADIVAGKLLVALAFNAILIAASLPLFALVFLFGGLGLPDVVPTFVVFLVTVLLLGAIGLTVSALTARLTVSYLASMCVALVLTVGLSVLTIYLQNPGQLSLLSLIGIPFSGGTPSTLTPLVQLDPLAALASALPSPGGGTVMGEIGTVHHAFGLPWNAPLWGAYTVLGIVFSLLLLVVTSMKVRSPRAWLGGAL